MTNLNNVDFLTDRTAGGRITPRALMHIEGTISIPAFRQFMEARIHGVITRLSAFGWFFNIGFSNGMLIVQRNGGELKINLEWCNKYQVPETALVSWNPEYLLLSFGDYHSHFDYPQVQAPSKYQVPPIELIQWLKEFELSPVTAFENEDAFCIRVHTSLQRFDEKFKRLLGKDYFWDLERKGNRIVARKPKREIDIQDILHGMLLDHMEISGISVARESRSSAGALDFLFTGTGKKGCTYNLCCEFKHLHSEDLISGLQLQLREYMRCLGVKNGAYCLLDFRGAYFSLPKKETETILGDLDAADRVNPEHKLNPIKIHIFKLSD
jgi:hypothetical protein